MTRPMIKQHRRPDGVMERPIVEIFHNADNQGETHKAQEHHTLTGSFQSQVHRKRLLPGHQCIKCRQHEFGQSISEDKCYQGQQNGLPLKLYNQLPPEGTDHFKTVWPRLR